MPLPKPSDIRCIILDRDGVINEDSDDYIKSPDEWQPIPGSLEAIARLHQKGYLITVATNQSGLARGYFDRKTLEGMHYKFTTLLASYGGKVDRIVLCPHGPNEGCTCRKPNTGMITTILSEFTLTPEQCLFIGDSYKDYQAADSAGCAFALVKTGKGERTLTQHPQLKDTIPVFDDLSNCINHWCSI